MTRETGQSLIFSCLGCDPDNEERLHVEVRVSQVCAGGTTILVVVTDADSKVQVFKGEDCKRELVA